MAPEVTAALIAGILGLVTAALSIVLSVRATRASAKVTTHAMETGKRAEQIRIKATESGEKLLAALAEVLIQLESLESDRDHRALTDEQWGSRWERIGKGAAEAYRLAYEGAIYLTPEIQARTVEILRPIFEGGIEASAWSDLAADIRLQHAELANLFRQKYLQPIL